VQFCYPLDYEALSSELIRELRGPRSQAALSRRLRYRSNVVRSWEAGRRFPTAARFFWLLERLGKQPNQALGHFYAAPPAWLAGLDLTTSAGVAQLLRDLRGKAKLADIATRARCSRFSVSRWLAGESEPRLPDLLRVVEAISLRGLDFVACFADPRTLPSAARRFDELETARRVAVELPWSHAVLRALELQQYRCLPRHEPGFIAAKLGIDLDEEQRCLLLLSRSGQISKQRGLWRVKRVLTVDTQSAGKRLLAWWAQVGAERLKAGRNGRFSYNLFTVSEPDLERLRELQLAYFRELRSIVAQSEPAERVVVTNLQLFALDE
jgi:transcriptional regulator with XRE-family HTH domain